MIDLRRRVSVLVASLVIAGIPALASAHAGNNDPNMVHACVSNVSKIVRIVGVTGSCLSAPALVAETPTHWAKVVQRAAPPCFDNDNRYVDCGNGTVTDTLTGLIWLKQADCFAVSDWATAGQNAAGLSDGRCGLTDGSSAGDWRLPTKDEWDATTHFAAIVLGCNPAFTREPALTNIAGTGCFIDGPQPFFGVTITSAYWSSTPAFEGSFTHAAAILIDNGTFYPGPKHTSGFVAWPVRGPR